MTYSAARRRVYTADRTFRAVRALSRGDTAGFVWRSLLWRTVARVLRGLT